VAPGTAGVGRVVDHTTRAPLAGMEVHLELGDGEARTDARGGFVFNGGGRGPGPPATGGPGGGERPTAVPHGAVAQVGPHRARWRAPSTWWCWATEAIPPSSSRCRCPGEPAPWTSAPFAWRRRGRPRARARASGWGSTRRSEGPTVGRCLVGKFGAIAAGASV